MKFLTLLQTASIVCILAFEHPLLGNSYINITLLTWQFRYWLLIEYIKMPMMLNHQRFEDNRSDKTELRNSKCEWLYGFDNEEREGLDVFKAESEEEDIGYIPFPLVAPPEKKLNYPTNIDKRIKSLHYLIYIPKIS